MRSDAHLHKTIIALLFGSAIFFLGMGYFTQKSPIVFALDDAGITAGSVDVQTMGITQTVFLPIVMNNYNAYPPPFGVQIYYNIDDASALGFQRLVDSGTTWVRKPIRWSIIEPNNTTPDNFNWTLYDSQYLNASTYQLRMIATIEGNPSWAAASPEGPVYTESVDDFLEFIVAVVERYDGDGYKDAPGSPVVNYWEFYNEPDHKDRWGYQGAYYAYFLSKVYPAVKAANPRAMVLMGGMAYDNFTDSVPDGTFIREFLDDFLNSGGGNYIDIANYHYYPAFLNWESFGKGIIGKNNYIKTKMAQYGVEKPMMVTETGIGSEYVDWQSRYVLQTFTRAIAANIKAVNWFVFNDLPPVWFYGLTTVDFVPKPAYVAFQVSEAQLSNVTYVRELNESELEASGAEGYVFTRQGKFIYVLWTDDTHTATTTVPASMVRKIDMYGSQTDILDGADGSKDGLVTVSYDYPAYLILNP